MASAAVVPKRVGRFDILMPIASGGMAVVFLARARGAGGFERDVALKLTHPHLRETEEFARQLVEEAKLTARIQHPNVVGVLDVGEDPLGVFLVLEYVEGTTLAGLKRSATKLATPMPLRVGARVVIDALLGLHAAHELRGDDGQPLGLVHRDFSPQNILVGMDGKSKLTDFGVAKAASRLGHTATGTVKGKTHYMSPEQARGQKVDRRCDVWAAGVIVWELIARQRLYPEDNDAAVILRLVSQPAPRLRTLHPDVPRALDEAVASALTLDPLERCPTAAALASELAIALEDFGGIATHEEVAAFVERAVGEQIQKRRKTVQRKLEARASGVTAPDDVTTDDAPATGSTRTVLASDTSEIERPKKPRKAAAWRWLGLAAAMLGAVSIGWWFRGTAGDDRGGATPGPTLAAVPEGGDESGLPSDDASASIDEPTTPLASTNLAPSASAPASPPPLPVVLIESPLPLSRLTVGKRAVSLEIGARSVKLELEEGETLPLFIAATSTDGRIATLRLLEGMTELTLPFSAAAASKPPPPPTAAPAAPLAPSPWEQAPAQP
jgi:serine/threonine protein kinase